MIRSILLLFCTTMFIYNTAIGQCDDRYTSEIFSAIEVETVTYSDVTGFEMDIYHPIEDMYTNRPMIIFAHGGAFIGGSKNNGTMVNLCNSFAKRGYVTASIQYSLAANITLLADSTTMIGTVMSAVADGKSAIRYMRKTAEEGNPYGIDPTQIWIGGNSAGAILSAHLAYLGDNDDIPAHIQTIIDARGGLEGDAGNDGYSSEVNGVINLAGGLNDPSWLSEDDEPLVSCHGDQDGIVPYDCNDVYWGDAVFGALDLVDICGSSILHTRADEVNLDHAFLPFPGDDHTPWSFDPAKEAEITNFVSDFLAERIECNIVSSTDDLEMVMMSIAPNPAKNQLQVTIASDITNGNVEVLNTNGQILQQHRINTQQLEINTSGLASGMYFLRFRSDDQYGLRRFVKID